jgi:hypothetical protein
MASNAIVRWMRVIPDAELNQAPALLVGKFKSD